MSLELLHCPKCGAMQPPQDRCGECGAKLSGRQADNHQLTAGDIARLSTMLFLGLAAVVVVGAAAVWLLISLL